MAPVDLMFVDAGTWKKLASDPGHVELAGRSVDIPRPEHLVAMKLHAAASPTRRKPESDWEDIRQLVLLKHLDISTPEFRELVFRYGGESAVRRVSSFKP